MFDAEQFISDKYKRLIVFKMVWYLSLAGVCVANLLPVDHFDLDVVNGFLALLFVFFAFETWRLR